MATERHRHYVERVSLHAADWCQPVGRFKHEKPGSSGLESVIYRARVAEETNAVVRSDGVLDANRQNLGEHWKRSTTRSRPSNARSLAHQKHGGDRTGRAAIQGRVFQCPEPYEPRAAESDC